MPRKEPKKKKKTSDIYKELNEGFSQKEEKQASDTSNPFKIDKKEVKVTPPKKFKGFYFDVSLIKEIKEVSNQLDMSESEFATKVFEIFFNNMEI